MLHEGTMLVKLFPRYVKIGKINTIINLYKPMYFRQVLQLFRVRTFPCYHSHIIVTQHDTTRLSLCLGYR